MCWRQVDAGAQSAAPHAAGDHRLLLGHLDAPHRCRLATLNPEPLLQEAEHLETPASLGRRSATHRGITSPDPGCESRAALRASSFNIHVLCHAQLCPCLNAHCIINAASNCIQCKENLNVQSLLCAVFHDHDFFTDLPAALRGQVARYRTRPAVANSALGQVRHVAMQQRLWRQRLASGTLDQSKTQMIPE